MRWRSYYGRTNHNRSANHEYHLQEMKQGTHGARVFSEEVKELRRVNAPQRPESLLPMCPASKKPAEQAPWALRKRSDPTKEK